MVTELLIEDIKMRQLSSRSLQYSSQHIFFKVQLKTVDVRCSLFTFFKFITIRTQYIIKHNTFALKDVWVFFKLIGWMIIVALLRKCLEDHCCDDPVCRSTTISVVELQ